jgi:hypothetical protein
MFITGNSYLLLLTGDADKVSSKPSSSKVERPVKIEESSTPRATRSKTNALINEPINEPDLFSSGAKYARFYEGTTDFGECR